MYLIILGLIIIGFSILIGIKNNVTYENHIAIISAIGRWADDNNQVGYEEFREVLASMEPYNSTLLRVTDWGLENILPKKYYRMIEPYIEFKTTK